LPPNKKSPIFESSVVAFFASNFVSWMETQSNGRSLDQGVSVRHVDITVMRCLLDNKFLDIGTKGKNKSKQHIACEPDVPPWFVRFADMA
jgi:hypothetical protein